MKQSISSILIFSILVLVPGQSVAHDATIVIERIGSFDVVPDVDTPVTVPGFPFGLNFEGTVTHEGHGDLKRIQLMATVNGESVYGPESLQGSGKKTTSDYVIPWVVYEPGQYVIEISGTHKGGSMNEGCKAAPAITNAYLKQEEIRKQNQEGNVISKVAKETGKNGLLWAKEKCEEEYFSKTITFVLDSL